MILKYVYDSILIIFLNIASNLHTYIHTYIIGHYNPTVKIIDLYSHTTSTVCINFNMNGRTYSLKSTFHDNFYLLPEFLSEIF